MGKAICLRCNAPLEAGDGISNGNICRPCTSTLAGVLETLDRPAAYVTRDLTVMTSNSLFTRYFGRFHHDAMGLSIGEAMQCRSAEKRDHCGEAALCLHCGIRRLIDLARITGESFSDIPLLLRDTTGAEQLFRFSCTKAEESILVVLTAGPDPMG